jgi:hypothetical protein
MDTDGFQGERGMHDVTVRLPMGEWTAAETAGFIERAVTDAFQAAGYSGSAFVIFRKTETGPFVSFYDGDGFEDPYAGVLPHGLQEPTRTHPGAVAIDAD